MKNEEKNEKSSSTTTTATASAPELPQIIGDPTEHVLTSPHDMTTDVDPAFAGDYQIVHGMIRLPVPDGNGGFHPRGRVYTSPARLRLGALDAYRMLKDGIVKRIDGKKPDKVGELPVTEAPATTHTAPGNRVLNVVPKYEGTYVALRALRGVYGDIIGPGTRCDADDDTARVLVTEGAIKRWVEPSGDTK